MQANDQFVTSSEKNTFFSMW